MKRSKVSLSHYKLLSCDMGNLIPIGMFEVLPGDTIQHATSALVRASPLVAPVMHPVHVRIHHWFVPYRLLWDKWEDFITGGPTGTDASAFPYISQTVFPAGGLGDYFGIPAGTYPAGTFSALPYRAYERIWNEFYRDQDLQPEVGSSYPWVGSGVDGATNVTMQNVCWEKDYFTSSRPWEQKGPAITIPLGTSAPVTTTGVTPKGRSVADATARDWSIDATGGVGMAGAAGPSSLISFLNPTGLQADLTGASAITVNALREAMALQRFEEARARYGSRYTEYLRYLGVRSSDARLQLPEYLGGGKQTIQFSEVIQTAPEGAATVGNTVGAMKGHGIGAMRSNRYRRFIEEHGLVMSLMSVRPKTIYQDGLARMWSRRVKEDFWQRELEHIGQQEVYNREVRSLHANPGGVFGYQDRYDDYRRIESTVAGEFRTTLNYWHMARNFAADPALNASFVSCVPTERNFASNTTNVLYVMANHSIQARRLVSGSTKSFIV